MRELRPGLWHWEAPHPQWEPTEPLGPSAASYAIGAGRPADRAALERALS